MTTAILMAIVGLMAIAAMILNSGDFGGGVEKNGSRNSGGNGRMDGMAGYGGTGSTVVAGNQDINDNGDKDSNDGGLRDNPQNQEQPRPSDISIEITYPAEGKKVPDSSNRLWIKWKADDPDQRIRKFGVSVAPRNLVITNPNLVQDTRRVLDVQKRKNPFARFEKKWPIIKKINNALNIIDNFASKAPSTKYCDAPCTTKDVSLRIDYSAQYSVVVFAIGQGEKVLAQSEPVSFSFQDSGKGGKNGPGSERGVILKITSPTEGQKVNDHKLQLEVTWSVDDPSNLIQRFAIILAPAPVIAGDVRVKKAKPLGYCDAPCDSKVLDIPKQYDKIDYVTLVLALGHGEELVAESQQVRFSFYEPDGRGFESDPWPEGFPNK